MADKSAIEWTDASWTPIRARNHATGKVGWHCEHDTPGCAHCYSEGFNKRLGTGLPFKPGHRKDIDIFLDEEMLTQPLRWRRPRMIFVCSMTDLFASFVPDEWIDRIFNVMARARWHRLQVLTKRSARMRQYLSAFRASPRNDGFVTRGGVRSNESPPGSPIFSPLRWPLPNVWLGVSCEDQARADERIPDLLATPAAVRFVSAEPLLGPIDFETISLRRDGERPTELSHRLGDYVRPLSGCFTDSPKLDWIIVGGESGPHARPMQIEWAESIVAQCRDAGVACFVKQLGSRPTFRGPRQPQPMPYLVSTGKGGDPEQWPENLRVREIPNAAR